MIELCIQNSQFNNHESKQTTDIKEKQFLKTYKEEIINQQRITNNSIIQITNSKDLQN